METKNEFYLRLDRLALTLRDRVWSMGFQLSAWMVVGHGAGLYFVLEAMKDGKFPPQLPADVAYRLFMVGLISSVAAMWCNLFILSRLSVRLDNFANATLLQEQREQLTDQMKASKTPRPKDWDKLDKDYDEYAAGFVAAGRRMWRVMILPILLSTVSIFSLLAGLSLPLYYGVFEPASAGSGAVSVIITEDTGRVLDPAPGERSKGNAGTSPQSPGASAPSVKPPLSDSTAPALDDAGAAAPGGDAVPDNSR